MIKGFPKVLSPHHWNYSLLERIESNEPNSNSRHFASSFESPAICLIYLNAFPSLLTIVNGLLLNL